MSGLRRGGRRYDTWPRPSTAIAPEDYPPLGELADRGFETVISLHGLADDRVLVGGGIGADHKRRVRDALEDVVGVPVEVVEEGPYAGTSPENLVNWLAGDGGDLQTEQGPSVRDDDRGAVVDTLATLLADGAL